MRRAVLISVLFLAACGSSSAAPASTATSSAGGAARCGPGSARTLAASGLARVYATSGGVFGCSSRTRHTVRLGQSKTCLGSPRVTAVAVAGELAAYGSEACGVDTGTGTLVVRRLSDGRQLQAYPAVSSSLGPESYRSVAAVVVKADGALAWIGVGSSIISHRKVTEVHAAAPGASSARLLDRGSAINTRSLRLRGSQLTWSDGGRTRSASLR
jgi:hypothetical protein